jgi:hypothetical protein
MYLSEKVNTEEGVTMSDTKTTSNVVMTAEDAMKADLLRLQQKCLDRKVGSKTKGN